jgi:hypothetical protein
MHAFVRYARQDASAVDRLQAAPEAAGCGCGGKSSVGHMRKLRVRD